MSDISESASLLAETISNLWAYDEGGIRDAAFFIQKEIDSILEKAGQLAFDQAVSRGVCVADAQAIQHKIRSMKW